MNANQQNILTEATSHVTSAASLVTFKLDTNGLTPEQVAAVKAFANALMAAKANLEKAFCVK